MNYLGSKIKLSDFIIEAIVNNVGTLEDKVFCELFGGTGIISRNLKGKVKEIIVNDIEKYSYFLLKHYLESNAFYQFDEQLINLNNLDGVEGFIYKNYCSGSGSGRLYFTDDNGKKIDAIRQSIEVLYLNGKIDNSIYSSLIALLLEASDKVANTASVYGAFLKKFKKTALQPLTLKDSRRKNSLNNTKTVQVYNEDSNDLIKKIAGDVLYLDPPYNHRQYGANYHLLNTIVEYKEFYPKGITGLRDYYRSNYCIQSKANDSLNDILKNANFKYIFLSYNNEGIIELEKIKEMMTRYGEYYMMVKNDYPRFKADNNRDYSASKTQEYLHILERK